VRSDTGWEQKLWKMRRLVRTCQDTTWLSVQTTTADSNWAPKDCQNTLACLSERKKY